MKKNRFITGVLGLAVVGMSLVATMSPAPAQAPGSHPHYIHALSDLRHARWLLNHPEEWNVQRQERDAVRDIDGAINAITAAATDDGKNVYASVPEDANLDMRGRFSQARALLDSALRDISAEEDNPAAAAWRANAIGAIQRAHGHVDHAMRDRHWDANQ